MSFTSDLTKFCKKEAPEANDKMIREIVMEVANRVIMRSPVGNPENWDADFVTAGTKLGWLGEGYVGGRFRGNWQYSFGSPKTEETDNIDAIGRQTLETIKAQVRAAKTAGVHWIANNLPYAERLENGYSKQAPQGMVALTELEMPQIVAMAKL